MRNLGRLLSSVGKTITQKRDEVIHKILSPSGKDLQKPSIFHMIEVGCVCKSILEARPYYLSFFAKKLKMTEEEVLIVVPFMVSLHDIGKLEAGFLAKIREASLLLGFTPEQLDTQDTCNIHNFVSYKFLFDYFLATFPVDVKDIWHCNQLWWALSAGAHHGSPPTFSDQMTRCRMNKAFQDLKLDGFDLLINVFGITKELLKKLMCCSQMDHIVWSVVTGLTVISDWVGSTVNYKGKFYFSNFYSEAAPVTVEDEQKWIHEELPKIIEKSMNVARGAIKDFGLEEYVSPVNPSPSCILHGRKPRVLQEKCIALRKYIGKNRFFAIIEAPTGEGKTEAALLLIDMLRGFYFGLPTMATANQMFERLCSILSGVFSGKNVQNALMYSQFILNGNEKFKVFASNTDPQNTDHKNNVGINSFLRGNRKGLLSQNGQGTVDQVLFSVLPARFSPLKIFGLIGKTIVIDEVHSYDSYMTAILVEFIKWAKQMRCSVILLSATIDDKKRIELVKAYTGESPKTKHLYPSITYAVEGQPDKIKSIRCKPCKKRIRLESLTVESMVSQAISKCNKDGGSAAIVVNTVGEAQRAFNHAKIIHGDVPVILLHSRLINGQRKNIEEEIVGQLDYDATINGKRPKKLLVIATQVIEMSLDIDFDYMWSEMAPIDALFQRMGRLRRFRPDGIIPEMIVSAPPTGVALEQWMEASWNKVYYDCTLIKTHQMLTRQKDDIIEIPKNVLEMVNNVYRDITEEDIEKSEANIALKVMETDRARANYKRGCQGMVKVLPTNPKAFLRKIQLEIKDDDAPLTRMVELASEDLICMCQKGNKLVPLFNLLCTMGKYKQVQPLVEINPDDEKSWLENYSHLIASMSCLPVYYTLGASIVVYPAMESTPLSHHRILLLNVDLQGMASVSDKCHFEPLAGFVYHRKKK